jgi:hyperosmotically inducible protein
MALIGCQSATNTNVANTTKTNANANSNVAVVVPNNSNAAANTGSVTSNSTWDGNVSRADYDRDRAKYEAQKGTSTIGQGANDSWIWFKTKSALATSNDLRDSTINVDVDNGVITLKGSVATAAQKTAAETAAKGIEGQKGIKNQLTVNANDSMTNQMTGGTTTNTTKTNTNANMKK